jgi:hypothetical protein
LSQSALTILRIARTDEERDIKLGLTVYSLQEWNSYTLHDTKTINAILRIRSGIYQPRVHDRAIRINSISRKVVSLVNQVDLTRELHLFKRFLIEGSDERSTYKAVCNILRSMLLRQGVVVTGYGDLWNNVKEHLHGFPLHPLMPSDILKGGTIMEREGWYVGFLNWLVEFHGGS